MKTPSGMPIPAAEPYASMPPLDQDARSDETAAAEASAQDIQCDSPDIEILPPEDGMDIDDGEIQENDAIEGSSSLPALATERLPSIPSRDGLQSYLQKINKFPMLDPEEETRLARLVRDKNDPQAAFRLVSSHLRLVVRIALDFQRRWMQNVLDLIQEGNVGLLRAVNKFDPDKGI